MKFNTILAVATAAIVSFTSTGAFAQSDKEKKQAEVRTKAEATLADFYKAQPTLKAQVQSAPGYAVFTTYGLSSAGTGQCAKSTPSKATTSARILPWIIRPTTPTRTTRATIWSKVMSLATSPRSEGQLEISASRPRFGAFAC